MSLLAWAVGNFRREVLKVLEVLEVLKRANRSTFVPLLHFGCTVSESPRPEVETGNVPQRGDAACSCL